MGEKEVPFLKMLVSITFITVAYGVNALRQALRHIGAWKCDYPPNNQPIDQPSYDGHKVNREVALPTTQLSSVPSTLLSNHVRQKISDDYLSLRRDSVNL